MGDKTKIQWADSTVNPIVGCLGCELYPTPGEIFGAIDSELRKEFKKSAMLPSKELFADLIDEVFRRNPDPSESLSDNRASNVTNIWHLKDRFADVLNQTIDPRAGDVAIRVIEQKVTCYAAKLHFNRAQTILDREGNKEPRKANPGFAPYFEKITLFEGRLQKEAKKQDLLGQPRPDSPWKDGLPRLVFVSDMGDAFSRQDDFGHLRNEVINPILNENGQRHLWLWLTKRPKIMASFAELIGGLPDNVCAMTTLIRPDAANLKRLEDLKTVKAKVKGLSIEPLWERFPAEKLDLSGIDWVIVGGESGAKDYVREFAIEWAMEIREHCKANGVAFFCKQLGKRPTKDGMPVQLRHSHGGDRDEWEESLRVREFPRFFAEYRRQEGTHHLDMPRKIRHQITETMSETNEELVLEPLSQEEIDEFKRLDAIVRESAESFLKCGNALLEIHEKKLWRACDLKMTWKEYCRSVLGVSMPYVTRIMHAAEIATQLKRLPIDNEPVSESQVRPLLKLDAQEDRDRAWVTANERAKEQGAKNPTAKMVLEAVIEILGPDKPVASKPTRTEQRRELLTKLHDVIAEKNSWDDAEQILKELVLLFGSKQKNKETKKDS